MLKHYFKTQYFLNPYHDWRPCLELRPRTRRGSAKRFSRNENSCGTERLQRNFVCFFLLPLLSPLASAIYSARLKRPPYEMPDDKIRADSDDDNTNTAARTTILTRSSNGHLYRYCTAGARDKALSCRGTR